MILIIIIIIKNQQKSTKKKKLPSAESPVDRRGDDQERFQMGRSIVFHRQAKEIDLFGDRYATLDIWSPGRNVLVMPF